MVSAHGGIAKTLEIIRRQFYWPGMVTQVREYIRSCVVCKTTKAPKFTHKPPMGQCSNFCKTISFLSMAFLNYWSAIMVISNT